MKIEELNGKTISIARNEKLDVEIIVNDDEFLSSWIRVHDMVYSIAEENVIRVASEVKVASGIGDLKSRIREYWTSLYDIDDVLKEVVKMKSITKKQYFTILSENDYYQAGYLHMKEDDVPGRIQECNLTVEQIMKTPLMSLKEVRSKDMVHSVIKGTDFVEAPSLLWEENKGQISVLEHNGVEYLIHKYEEDFFSVKAILSDEIISEYFVDCAKKQLDSAFRMGLDPYDYRIYVDGVDLDDLDEIGDIFANIELPDSFIDSEVYVEALKEIQQLTCDYVAEELDTVDYLNEYKMEVKI